MSTPTINTATQGLARVVTDLEHQVQETPQHAGPPDLNEVLGLAEQMRAMTGDSMTPTLDRVWAASAAIDKAEDQITGGHIDADGLLDLDPEEITTRVLDSCRDRAARDTLAYQNGIRFRDALAGVAAAALSGAADDVVKAMRSDFDKHIKVITGAAKAGITETTDTTELLTTGTEQQIAAYRALPAAVTALEQIAGLRVQLTRVLRYGPPIHPVHLFTTGVSTRGDAEGLAARYDGTTEVVQYNQPVVGSTLTRVRVERLGGRWLALATYPDSAIKLRINTAAEVQAQYAGLGR